MVILTALFCPVPPKKSKGEQELNVAAILTERCTRILDLWLKRAV